MERAVRNFKTLSRSEKMPTGLDNNWVFGVRHIDLKPPGDMVVAVHPASRLLLQGHPTQIIFRSSERERAKATVTALLQAFFRGSVGADYAPFAPWGWSTDNPELADTIGLELAAAGISGGLENVRVCSAKEKMILEEVWSEIRDLLMCFSGGDWSEPDTDTQGSSGRAAAPSVVSPGDSSKCHGCALASETFSSPMKKCSGCQKAWYHSQDCQRSHWKKHKGICVANRPVPAPSTTSLRMDPTFNFYNNIARKSHCGPSISILSQSAQEWICHSDASSSPARTRRRTCESSLGQRVSARRRNMRESGSRSSLTPVAVLHCTWNNSLMTPGLSLPLVRCDRRQMPRRSH